MYLDEDCVENMLILIVDDVLAQDVQTKYIAEDCVKRIDIPVQLKAVKNKSMQEDTAKLMPKSMIEMHMI